MSYTKHTCYRTKTGPSASEVAAFILSAFPGAVLLAFTFYPAEVFPWLAKLIEVLR